MFGLFAKFNLPRRSLSTGRCYGWVQDTGFRKWDAMMWALDPEDAMNPYIPFVYDLKQYKPVQIIRRL